jgi:hypothetical protein
MPVKCIAAMARPNTAPPSGLASRPSGAAESRMPMPVPAMAMIIEITVRAASKLTGTPG